MVSVFKSFQTTHSDFLHTKNWIKKERESISTANSEGQIRQQNLGSIFYQQILSSNVKFQQTSGLPTRSSSEGVEDGVSKAFRGPDDGLRRVWGGKTSGKPETKGRKHEKTKNNGKTLLKKNKPIGKKNLKFVLNLWSQENTEKKTKKTQIGQLSPHLQVTCSFQTARSTHWVDLTGKPPRQRKR